MIRVAPVDANFHARGDASRPVSHEKTLQARRLYHRGRRAFLHYRQPCFLPFGAERRFPALHRSVCDETGAVRRHVNVWVNAAHVRDRGGLDAALAAGDVITILPAVSGG